MKASRRLPRTSKRRCCVCGFRVRGNAHYEGKHHKEAERKAAEHAVSGA